MNPERRDVLFFMLQHQQNQLIRAQHILGREEEEGGRGWYGTSFHFQFYLL